MSLTATRLSLKHRCTVQRDSKLATDDGWGNPQTPVWAAHISDLACRAWSSGAREPVDSDRTVVIEDLRLIVPLGTDVTEKDRIGDVTDRGSTILPGPMGVEAILYRPTHLELVLVAVS